MAGRSSQWRQRSPSNPGHSQAGGQPAGVLATPPGIQLPIGCQNAEKKYFPISPSNRPFLVLLLCYLHNTVARWSGLFLGIWGKFRYEFLASSYSVSLEQGVATFSIKLTQ